MNTTLRAAATTGLAALAVTSLALTVGSPAMAATQTFTDPDDVKHGVDLEKVWVKNGPKNLRVVLTHTNLRRSPASGAGGAVYIDTDPADKGPELVFVGGYFEGTDYSLLRTEGFGVKNWGTPVKGSYELKLNFETEKTWMRISQPVLGGVDKVRVAVKVGADRPDGTSVVDWLGEPRSFTPWIARV